MKTISKDIVAPPFPPSSRPTPPPPFSSLACTPPVTNVLAVQTKFSKQQSFPLEPHPPIPGSEHSVQGRRGETMGGMAGKMGMEATHPPLSPCRQTSRGFAYSTDEASACLESEMILNCVGSPLKKTPGFWDMRRSSLDRLRRRRDKGMYSLQGYPPVAGRRLRNKRG